MKIVQINSFSNGSTGKIMMSIHNELLKEGHESYVVWGRGRKSQNKNEIYMNDKIGVYYHALMSRLTGKTGFYSKKSTKRLLKKLDEIKPDIIHLHNIHGYYINIELLFNYIKKNKIKVVWTLHDCWSFTGQCPHFITKNCDKWKTGCYNCPMIHEYPKTIKDNSKWNYKKKKELFTNVDMTIITPSKWLSKLVKESYLNKYEVEVINNGIDTNIFKPTESNFRKKYHLENKKIILGVASTWTWKKGLYDFIELSKIIDENYQIVLVGLSKKQIKQLPNNIIGITRTENQNELAGIYSTSDIFFNPTYEDNYPTVNLEALACETPVISYDTGGCSECIDDNKHIVNKIDFFKNVYYYLNTSINKDNIIYSNISNVTNEYIVTYKKILGGKPKWQ